MISHNPSVCSDEGLMLETSAKHHITKAKNLLYPTFVDQTHIQRTRPRRKTAFLKQVFQCLQNYITYYEDVINYDVTYLA